MCYHIIGLPVLLRDTRNGDHIVDEAIDDLNLGHGKIVDLLLVAEEVLMGRREGREREISLLSVVRKGVFETFGLDPTTYEFALDYPFSVPILGRDGREPFPPR